MNVTIPFPSFAAVCSVFRCSSSVASVSVNVNALSAGTAPFSVFRAVRVASTGAALYLLMKFSSSVSASFPF